MVWVLARLLAVTFRKPVMWWRLFLAVCLMPFGLGVSACLVNQDPLRLALIAIEAGRHDLAIRYLETVERGELLSEKQKFDVIYLRARNFERQGSISDAIAIYRDIRRTHKTTVYGFLAEQKLRQHEIDYDGSAESFALNTETVADNSAGAENVSLRISDKVRDRSELRDYFLAIRKKIESYWNYPCLMSKEAGNCNFRDARVSLETYISHDGSLISARIIKSSGIQEYDNYVIEAVVLAAPFAPLPSDLRSEVNSPIYVTMGFEYRNSLERSVTENTQ